MIRVGLADDQALVRSGFAALLDAEDDFSVVGSAADGFGAVRLAREHRPDVLLMDIRMPGLDGIAATREIAASPGLARVRVVILTTFGLDEYIFEGLRAGAAGFLVKDTDAAELIRAVRVIASGDSLLSPAVTRRLVEEFALRTRPASPAPGLSELTSREREVVALVASGLSNEEIAARIYVSQSTVKTHVARAMIKLGARDRAQLVVISYEAGLVRPGWARTELGVRAAPGYGVHVSIYDIPVNTLSGEGASLGDLAGKALLVVNVASKCGLTPQYTALEALHERLSGRGFAVVGFPCNQFGGQEPGTADEIAEFCSASYGVTFPMFEKIEVNGPGRHPVYAELTAFPDAAGEAGDIHWNFEKFLLRPDGTVAARFRPRTAPDDPEVLAAIEENLPG